MKKLFCILISFSLAFSLCACGFKNLKDIELPPLPQVTEEIVTPKPTATPQPVIETSEPTQAAELPEPTPIAAFLL